MMGGTYAEAIRAGFTPEQAGMLARLGIETRAEAIEEYEAHQRRQAEAQRPHWSTNWAFVSKLVLVGTAIQIFVSAAHDGPHNPEQRAGSVGFALLVIAAFVALPALCGYVIGRSALDRDGR